MYVCLEKVDLKDFQGVASLADYLKVPPGSIASFVF